MSTTIIALGVSSELLSVSSKLVCTSCQSEVTVIVLNQEQMKENLKLVPTAPLEGYGSSNYAMTSWL